jgi:hypothetical protein
MTLVTPVSVVMVVAGLRRQNNAALLHVGDDKRAALALTSADQHDRRKGVPFADFV